MRYIFICKKVVLKKKKKKKTRNNFYTMHRKRIMLIGYSKNVKKNYVNIGIMKFEIKENRLER